MLRTFLADDRWTGRSLLLLALAVGALARFGPALTSDFPLMDGGMFFVAARALGDNGFALPARLPYATLGPSIPFCYPPLAFYLVAGLQKLGVSLEWSLRLLPALFSTLCIPALWNIGRRLFAGFERGQTIAGIAALSFALLPFAFLPLLGGGGLTRAPGLFFALWGVERALSFWRDGERRAWLGATVLLALCLLTHLERARFLVIALFVVWLATNRTGRGLGWVGGCIAGALLLSSPWWGTCWVRFGVGPFVASYQSGSGAWQGSAWQDSVWRTALPGAEYEPGLLWLCVAGLVVFARRVPFLWLWFGAIAVLEVRSGRNFIGAPESLAASALLWRLRPFWRWGIGAPLALWLVFQAGLTAGRVEVLSPSARAAMLWCREHSPPGARFLVVPARAGGAWIGDWEGEWFPALAERAAPLTVQGSEWLPGGAFARQQQRFAQVASARNWNDVQRAVGRFNPRCEFVFLPRTRPDIEAGLRADARWKLVWSNTAAWVFARPG